MFRGLIASAPSGGVGGGFGRGGVLSVILHGVVIYAAVVATYQPAAPKAAMRAYTSVIIFDDTDRDEPATPAVDWPTTLSIATPDVPDFTVPSLPPAPYVDVSMPGGFEPDTAVRLYGLDRPHDATRVFVAAGVDEQPALLTAAPLDYPALLRQAGVEGSVTIELVVDTTGHAEPHSVRVVMSSNRAFEAPARTAVLRSLFRPGRVRGQLVRVLVQVPVSFTIRR